MAANNTDFFTEVGNPGTATTLAAPGHTLGGTSFTVGSTSNWPTTTGAVFAVDTITLVNGIETRNPGSYTEWEGVVSSGTTITSAVIRYGTDQNYPAGSTTRVYIPVASSRENRLVQGIQVHANQNGTLIPASVTTALTGTTLPTNTVATASITDNSVTASKLATNAITLGYSQITGNLTTTSTTYVQATGLTSTVTIPAGGRRVKITAYISNSYNLTANKYCNFSIWDGTVGSGTQLNQSQSFTNGTPGGAAGVVVIATGTPAAGSKTYNVGFSSDNSGGTNTLVATATAPAFILVELI